jgi:hypothetical protein
MFWTFEFLLTQCTVSLAPQLPHLRHTYDTHNIHTTGDTHAGDTHTPATHTTGDIHTHRRPPIPYPSPPTLHPWCGAFLLCNHARCGLPNHTLCLMRPLTYMVDLFPNIYNPDSYFLSFVPTSVQRRYSCLFYFLLVVTYVPTSVQRR